MTENEISRHIVECAIEVHRTLGGPGLLESVYEESLCWELGQRRLGVKRQVSLPIPYKGHTLGSPLRIDLIVGSIVIIECKAVTQYHAIFESQTLTYFATDRFETRHGRQFWGTGRQEWDSSSGERVMSKKKRKAAETQGREEPQGNSPASSRLGGFALNEATVEQAALGWFESLGFDIEKGADISPGADSPERESYEDVVLQPRLRAALRKINSHLSEDAIEEAVRVITRPPEPTLEQNNRWFHRLLTDGIDVEYRTPDGETRGDKAWLVDFANPKQNDLLVVNQFTVKCGNATRRPDLVVFLNGLPIVVIELKDPTNEQADLWTAFRQLQNYKQNISPLFVYNELLVISDGNSTRVGSLTAGSDRFSPWRSMEDYREPGHHLLEVLIKGLFEPTHLLDYLRNCITFEEDERTGDIIKKIAAYHQFRACAEYTHLGQSRIKTASRRR